MSSKFFIGGILILGAMTIVIGQVAEVPTAKVTVKVLDEAGNPIPDAVVGFGFIEARPAWGTAKGEAVNVTTDKTGMATGSGHSDGLFGCGVQKDGYYDGWPSTIEFKDVVLGKWQPWNKVYPVVLRKIVNPIPMYAKKVSAKIPAMNQSVGFDLSVGDWVKPFGKGTTSDFILNMSKVQNGPKDFNEKLIITFTHNGDGIQVAQKTSKQDQGGSILNFPRNAPQEGYIDNWATTISYVSGSYKEERSNGIGYFFRVRTIKTNKGEIQSSDYGKISEDIDFFETGTSHPGISFTYYFNPTGTTNLEFDKSKNLLTNLDDLEQVHNP